MALSEYEKFSNPPLVFPIGGKQYTLKPVDIPTGIILDKIISGEDKELAKQPASYLWKMLLGDMWDEFAADGVPLEAATRAGLTALAEHQYGRAIAEATWEAGADPKALQDYMEKKFPPNRAQRRSKSTAAASSTPPRASTSGTRKSPQK